MSTFAKLSISLPPELLTSIQSRDDATSRGIRSGLERYYAAMSLSRRKLSGIFSDRECSMLLDVCEGKKFDHSIAINLIAAAVSFSVEQGKHVKWKMSDEEADDLLAKLRDMTYFERLTLVDAIECWWHDDSDDKLPPSSLLSGHPDDRERDIRSLSSDQVILTAVGSNANPPD